MAQTKSGHSPGETSAKAGSSLFFSFFLLSLTSGDVLIRLMKDLLRSSWCSPSCQLICCSAQTSAAQVLVVLLISFAEHAGPASAAYSGD